MDQMRKMICLLLTAAVLCSLLLPVFAAEPEDVLPAAETGETTAETTEATEEETTEPEETEPEETEPEETEPPFSAPYTPYFGLLHSHTKISSGQGDAAEAYDYAKNVAGLDFLAVTDTSHSFDGHMDAAIDKDASTHSREWAEGIAAADAATGEDFAAFFGYEMSWPEILSLGHVITLNTPGFQSSRQEPYKEGSQALAEYFKTLAKAPDSVSILCHPSAFYGDFRGFADHKGAYDDSVFLLEVTDETGPAWRSYDQALQAGWQVAPSASQNNHDADWGTANDDRTVILAEELTRESLLEAIRSRRVYATRDKDLHLYFSLNGEDMGSRVSSTEGSEIEVMLYDPTDSALGTLEVITEEGCITSRTVSENYGEVTFSISNRYRYYYLKLTQPDGDIAVTAPVWTEDFTAMGIGSLSCDTQVPVAGEEVQLELTLYNEEPVDLVLTSLEIRWKDAKVLSKQNPGIVPARKALDLVIPYTHKEPGTAQLEVVVTGTAQGEEITLSEIIELRYRSVETVTGMLVDGSHGYENLEHLSGAVALAADADMTATLFTGDLPRGSRLLVIPGLAETPSEIFLQDLAAFLEGGGTLILWCGGESAGPENQLLQALGSRMRFGADAAGDSCTGINKNHALTSGLTANQFFVHTDGRSVEPGNGTALVKTGKGQTVLAWDSIGGGILAAGSPFLEDAQLAMSDSVWAIPTANESILRKILGTSRVLLQQTDIRQVRRGTADKVYRIKGYVTAGTANPNTIFPGTVYLQDKTGGIALSGYTATDLKIGTPMEVIGTLKQENGNPVLTITSFRVLTEKAHRYDPDVMSYQNATNYLAHGGEVVKIQGKITKRTLTKNKKGLTALTVKDDAGDTANVIIESTVLSGSTGKNTLAEKLKVGRNVRVIGILHKNAKGEEVIRVRDCDEVVYLKAPKKADKSNPPTGDKFRFLWFLLEWL